VLAVAAVNLHSYHLLYTTLTIDLIWLGLSSQQIFVYIYIAYTFSQGHRVWIGGSEVKVEGCMLWGIKLAVLLTFGKWRYRIVSRWGLFQGQRNVFSTFFNLSFSERIGSIGVEGKEEHVVLGPNKLFSLSVT